MTTHKEYSSLKPCQRKTQLKKTNGEGKRVQYSCVSLSAFRIASLKPCKEKPCGKKTIVKEKEYNQHISSRTFTPPHEYMEHQLFMMKISVNWRMSIGKLLECSKDELYPSESLKDLLCVG